MFDSIIDRCGTASYKWDHYGAGVLPLWVADMDLASPPCVIQALTRRAAHGVFGYSNITDSLQNAVLVHLSSRYGWEVDPDWLVWLPGVIPGLNLACRAYAHRGETVMTLVPAYPPFLSAPRNQARHLHTVPLEWDGERWQIPLRTMEAAITPDTRVILLCSPHNPLGRVWSADQLAAVVDLCWNHKLILVSDEIHCDLVLDAVPHVPSAASSPHGAACVVTLMSPSKTFNLPGLNFAFAVIPDELLRQRFVAAGQGWLGLPGCFAVVGAEAAYREGAEWLAELLGYLRGNRDYLQEYIATSLPGVTMGHVEATYLAWLDARATGVAEPAAACLKAGAALSDGAAFGASAGFLRLNFGCPRSLLAEGLRRIGRALK